MGKISRGAMCPLIARRRSSRTSKLTCPIRRCLLWRHNAAESLPTRATPFVFLPPIGARSGAQALGHIARRALHRIATCHFHLPERLARLDNAGGSDIYFFEIFAAILTACVVSEQNAASSRSRVICIDNHAALDALVKGTSPSELGTVLFGAFWRLSARFPPPGGGSHTSTQNQMIPTSHPASALPARVRYAYAARGLYREPSRQPSNLGMHVEWHHPDYELDTLGPPFSI